MKKILTLIFGVFLLFGCSGQNEEIKNNAIEAYVNSINKLGGSERYEVKLAGEISAPESLFSEEMKGNISLDGIIDVEGKLFKFDMKVNDGETDETFSMYMDDKYIYMNIDDTWIKEPLDAETKDALETEEAKDSGELTIEAAREMFDSFKEVEYSQATQDGEEGYLINAKLDLNSIFKLANQDEDMTAEVEKQLEQAKALLDKMDVIYEVFIPNNAELYATHTITLNLEVLKSPINIGPIKVDIKPTEEEVKIPAAAKKAPIAKDSGLLDI